jgi:hypothetical protein
MPLPPPPPPPKGAEVGKLSAATATAKERGSKDEGPYSPSAAMEDMDVDWEPSSAEREEAPTNGTLSADPRGADGQNTSASGNMPPADKPLAATGAEDGSGANIQLRAQEYIKEVKAKHVADIKAKLGKDMLAYQTISAHNFRDRSATMLGSGLKQQGTVLEGMVDMGKGRLLTGGLKLDLKKNRIITTNYNTDWSCLMCGPHGSRPAFNVRGSAGGAVSRQADQSFPPILPATRTEKCLVILWIENGNLMA